MKVSPEEVHELSKEGLPVSEIARRLKISRKLVNLKLREFELDKREHYLDNRKRELDIEEADLDARERKINNISELEERVHLLEPKVQFLNSEVDSLTKKKYVLEETITSKKEVLEEIKDYEEKREDKTNQLSELSNRADLQRRSAKKLDETQNLIKTESLTLLRIKAEIIKNRRINAKLVDLNSQLEEETRVKKKAINEIEQSYYGFLELTKQIDLYSGLPTKKNTHEEIRNQVLKGMKIIAEEAKITKPDFQSDLQALLRDPNILKKIFFKFDYTVFRC